MLVNNNSGVDLYFLEAGIVIFSLKKNLKLVTANQFISG